MEDKFIINIVQYLIAGVNKCHRGDYRCFINYQFITISIKYIRNFQWFYYQHRIRVIDLAHGNDILKITYYGTIAGIIFNKIIF